MPLYNYMCQACGPFKEWNNMSQFSAESPCPECGTSSGRAISTPLLSHLDGNTRIAHQRNEKSADEPLVVRRKKHDPAEHGKSHGHGHHHKPGHGHAPSRPWMFGH